MLLGVIATLARLDERHRAVAPGTQQRADARSPGPFARAVEQLAVADVVAELELLVGQQVAVRVQDALRPSRGARRVVELGRVVGGGIRHVVAVAGASHRLVEVDVARLSGAADHQDLLGQPIGDPMAVGRVGHHRPGLGVAQPVLDALVAVKHRHRQEDRSALVGADEHRRGLGQRGQQRGHAVLAFNTRRLEHVGEAVGQILQLAEADPPLVALPVLPHHRGALTLVLVAHVVGDVVALRHLPAMRGTHVLVAAELVLPQAHLCLLSDRLPIRCADQSRRPGRTTWPKCSS